MDNQNIIIIGAGASGIMAAIAAARNHAKVTLLEHTDKIGKKLLATGNGRCNITNLVQNPQYYRSDNSGFPVSIIEQFDEQECLKLFHEIGIYTKNKNNYIYPYSEQASTVLDILKMELERLDITIIYEVTVKSMIAKGKKIQINTDSTSYICDRVIISTGSKAAPKTGSDGSGYELAKMLGHHIIKPLPALVQLRTNDKCFKSLAGIRCEARLSLFIDGVKCCEDLGELQLTDYGISGIPTFQISRFAVRALDKKKEVIVSVDFMPEMKEEELSSFIEVQRKNAPNKKLEEILIGLLNKKLMPVLLMKAGVLGNIEGRDLKRKQISQILKVIKAFEVQINSYNSFEQAQVCSGGVDTREVSDKTLESKKLQGVYFTGEILDVDGICGGYNLQWAWSSGYVAGNHASR